MPLQHGKEMPHKNLVLQSRNSNRAETAHSAVLLQCNIVLQCSRWTISSRDFILSLKLSQMGQHHSLHWHFLIVYSFFKQQVYGAQSQSFWIFLICLLTQFSVGFWCLSNLNDKNDSCCCWSSVPKFGMEGVLAISQYGVCLDIL